MKRNVKAQETTLFIPCYVYEVMSSINKSSSAQCGALLALQSTCASCVTVVACKLSGLDLGLVPFRLLRDRLRVVLCS